MATETNVISLYMYYNRQLLQQQDRVSDFIIYLNIFGEFDHFEMMMMMMRHK